MNHINLDYVEQVAEVNDGLHRVYFKSGRDIVISNGKEILSYYFSSHREWPQITQVATDFNRGPL